MTTSHQFGLNRIMQPDLSLLKFLEFAADCSARGIEIRNDLADPSLLGGMEPESVRKFCREKGLEILTVNALQRFNDPVLFGEKILELNSLLKEAAAVGCRKIVLCPVNDPEDRRSEETRKEDLVAALKRYAPLFRTYGMVGLVEPLGFEICSVRFKKQAVDAIAASGEDDVYKIVHDTFHHYMSGETTVFPVETGLVHVSGVTSGKNRGELTDDDRVLVDPKDVIDNRGQLSALIEGGFDGIVSYEPFSPEVQLLNPDALKKELLESFNYLMD